MDSISILSHMARSGGTLICKCLGVMQDVVLLSEIHPDVSIELNALMQAHQWFQLLTQDDLRRLSAQKGVDFADAIQLIQRRCAELDKSLLIRDWSHIDFTGVPYVAKPSFTFSTADQLHQHFIIHHFTTVRHPIDQWLSLNGLGIVKGKLALTDFLLGYRKFAEHAVKIGYVRYEDFVESPESATEKICQGLQIRYDPSFLQRWRDYKKLTGDMVKDSRNQGPIQTLPRRPTSQALLNEFDKNNDYHVAIELLGYA